MRLQRHSVGQGPTNLYVATCEETLETMIVDPGIEEKEADGIVQRILRPGLKVRFIVNTHGHADHTGGNRFLKESTRGDILFHEKDSEMITRPWAYFSESAKRGIPCPSCGGSWSTVEKDEDRGRATLRCSDCGFALEALASPPADRLLHGGETIEVGSLSFEVIHTPGHTPGSISLYSRDERVVFTGDTLFKGSAGRTTFLLGSEEDMMRSLNRLMEMPDDTVVYPGHDEKTTIGIERRTNAVVLKMNRL